MPEGAVKSDGPRACVRCGIIYSPKKGGFNSLYCGWNCKKAFKGPRKYHSSTRKRAFGRMKDIPDRYELHKANGRKSRNKVRDWLADYKTTRGCVDCGFKAHFAALQMDHEGPKSAEIANLRTSVARLQEEIDDGKCVVRCANCHSIRTWHQKNGLEYKPVRKDSASVDPNTQGDQGSDGKIGLPIPMVPVDAAPVVGQAA